MLTSEGTLATGYNCTLRFAIYNVVRWPLWRMQVVTIAWSLWTDADCFTVVAVWKPTAGDVSSRTLFWRAFRGRNALERSGSHFVFTCELYESKKENSSSKELTVNQLINSIYEHRLHTILFLETKYTKYRCSKLYSNYNYTITSIKINIISAFTSFSDIG